MLKLFYIPLFIGALFSSNSHADSIPAEISIDPDRTGTCRFKNEFFKTNYPFSSCASWIENRLGYDYGWSLSGADAYNKSGLGSFDFNGSAPYTANSCPNPEYPTLNGDFCESAPFVITEEITASLSFKMDSSQSMLDEMIQKNNELGDFIESTENAFDTALDLTASSTATINAMDKQLDTANEFKELNPDSSLITSFANEMNVNLSTATDLNNDNLQELESIVEIQNDSQLLFNDNNEIIGFTQSGIDSIYTAGEQILTTEPTEEQFNAQINVVDSNYDSILTNYNQSNSNANNVDMSKNADGQTQPQVKAGNVNSNNSKIQEKVKENNNIFGNISNASNNGEVCSGSKCVPVPDVEEEDEDQTARITAPTTEEGFYTSKYPDGFSGLLDKSVTGFKSGPFYSGMNQFVFNVGGGALPSWTLCFNTGIVNFGCSDVMVPLYVWNFIKACLMICTVFLCRAIVFGG